LLIALRLYLPGTTGKAMARTCARVIVVGALFVCVSLLSFESALARVKQESPAEAQVRLKKILNGPYQWRQWLGLKDVRALTGLPLKTRKQCHDYCYSQFGAEEARNCYYSGLRCLTLP